MINLIMKGSTIVIIFIGSYAKANDWDSHKSELARIADQIDRSEKELKALLLQKKHSKGGSPDLLKEIEATHREGEKALKDYNKEVEHIQYRHPGREAEHETRSYSIITPRTIEDYESDIGVDGKLDKVKQRMKKQYGNFSVDEAPGAPEPKESELKKSEPQRIILKK